MSGWHKDQECGSNRGKANEDAAEDEEPKEMFCIEERKWVGVRQRKLADCGRPRGERSLMGSQAQQGKGVNLTIEERDDCLQDSRGVRGANKTAIEMTRKGCGEEIWSGEEMGDGAEDKHKSVTGC